MANYYPPVGFHFSVSFDSDVSTQEADGYFQSVSGLNIEVETETINEGGENRFVHQLPVRSKFPNLVLKRGMLVNSELLDWCLETFQTMEVTPANLIVSLLNEEHEPLKSWKIKHAWPVKWNVSDLNAEESKLVVETIELSYHYFSIE